MKTRSYKNRKTDIFPKGLTYILERKDAFLGYKNKKFKRSKYWHFSMVLVQKWPFFQVLFLCIVGYETAFYDIQKRKNAFLGYKTKKFKKSKNWHFPKGVNPWFWSNNGHFSNLFF